MKPRVQDKLNEILDLIERLRVAAESTVEKMESVRNAHDELVTERFRQRKELATLSRSAEDLAQLQSENDHYRECLDKLKEDLKSLLAGIKSLRSEYRT